MLKQDTVTWMSRQNFEFFKNLIVTMNIFRTFVLLYFDRNSVYRKITQRFDKFLT